MNENQTASELLAANTKLKEELKKTKQQLFEVEMRAQSAETKLEFAKRASLKIEQEIADLKRKLEEIMTKVEVVDR